jgi:hypothetical protein
MAAKKKSSDKKPVPVTRGGQSAKAGFADAAEVGWKPNYGKNKTNGRSMSADTYEKKAAAKVKQLRSTGRRYDSLEAAIIEAGVPVSKSEQMAQLIMEKAMPRGNKRPTNRPIKGR